jgi:threonine/homoserine/homoserine lactone efflux protein
MAPHGRTEQARAGQRVALTVAGVGVLWVLVTMIGSEYGWSNGTRAIFDLAALAGFGFALWQTFQLWRSRRNDKGEN